MIHGWLSLLPRRLVWPWIQACKTALQVIWSMYITYSLTVEHLNNLTRKNLRNSHSSTKNNEDRTGSVAIMRSWDTFTLYFISTYIVKISPKIQTPSTVWRTDLAAYIQCNQLDNTQETIGKTQVRLRTYAWLDSWFWCSTGLPHKAKIQTSPSRGFPREMSGSSSHRFEREHIF